MRTSQKSLTVICYGGLCNRLKVLLSGLVMAEASNRHFQMVWEQNYLCNCKFSDLFENNFNIIADAASVKVKPAIYGRYSETIVFPSFDILMSTKDTLFLRSNRSFIEPGRYLFHDQLEKKFVQLLGQLKPVAYVKEKVARLKESFAKPTMGVHIRKTDFYKDHPDTQVGLEYFMRYIDRFMLKFPKGKVFIATDEDAPDINFFNSPFERIEARAKKTYADKAIFSYPRSRQRNSCEAIQDALVDLLLLRQADYFVGTRYSTFSEFAVLGRKAPYVMVPKINFVKRVTAFLKSKF